MEQPKRKTVVINLTAIMSAAEPGAAPAVEDAVEDMAPERPAKLLNRNFVLLWMGQAVSQLGSQVQVVAMVFWIKRATDSASLIGAMMMFPGILNVVLS